MKITFTLITVFFLLAPGEIYSQENEANGLFTGWYFETKEDGGVRKEIFKSQEIISINPKPILTVKDFDQLEMYESMSGDYGLSIRIKEGKATEVWLGAIEKAYMANLKMVLVIDNEVIYAPKVASPIMSGISAINRADLTESELQEIKRKLELQIKHQ